MSLQAIGSAPPRILSIQSHVVSGYCGNKSATFPLQLLEFEVDVINSVQLSNHTQYKVAKGQIFTSEDLEKLYAGLKENNLLRFYANAISGYVADVGYVESMAKLISDTKKERERCDLDCFYAVDPVLGDDGVGYYVPNGPKMAQAYKEHLLPLADMMTPNRFEASVLSGVEIKQDPQDGLKDALEAINVLHKRTGVQIVALTSLQLDKTKDELVCLVSHWPGASDRSRYGLEDYRSDYLGGLVWTITVPKINIPFTGTGDLFTALLTAWLHKTRFNFKKSLENTVNSIKDILNETTKWSNVHGDDQDLVRSRELRLVQNKDKILKPSDRIKATPIRVEREKM